MRYRRLAAADETKWLQKLIRLIDELRDRIGPRGRNVVQIRYSAQTWAQRVGRILGEAARCPGHS